MTNRLNTKCGCQGTFAVLLVLLLLFAAKPLRAERDAHLIPVPLPITGVGDTQIKRKIDQLLERLEPEAERPLLVLEFQASDVQTGVGSEFERCLSLARYLASDRLSGVRTVAYLPGGARGHAVLCVLACEEVVIGPDAQLGEAGRGESHVDATMQQAYRDLADRRRTIPAAIALGMLDAGLTVHRAETIDGVRYVLDDELAALQDSTTVSSVEADIAAGDLGLISGSDLRLRYGFASRLAADRTELASALELPAGSLDEDPSLGGDWRPILVSLDDPISSQSVNWVIRSIDDQVKGPDAVNLVCLSIESPGGSIEDSLRLASYLAELDSTKVRTIAYVEAEARADAALIAWACDQLVIASDAVLGGPGASTLRSSALKEVRRTVQQIANDAGRDWSLAAALLDPELDVYRYRRNDSSELRFFCEQELAARDDVDLWTRGDPVELAAGISGHEANELGLVTQVASSLAEVKRLYQIDTELVAVEPNWAHMLVEKLASPQLAGTLLFIGVFAGFIEISQAGLSGAGFVSALCFVLYFWSQYLHGTAGWLEVLLFLVGVTGVLLEIFVLPGFGIFGLGGAFLMISSLVLASQTFVIPRNPYQMQQMPASLMIVALGMGGAFISLAAVRKYLPNAPIFRRMMLPAPDVEELDERERRESLADFAHLKGKLGRTTTQLTPSGKARFGDDTVDVISDGDVVPRGTDVTVVSVRGSRVQVEPLDTHSTPQPT